MNLFAILCQTGNNIKKTKGKSTWGAYFSFVLPMAFVSLLVFSLPVLAATTGKVIIKVANTAEVAGPIIYLSDVAKITAPDFFKEELARVDLGKSPRAGRMKQLSGKRIELAVNAMGFNEDDINIQVPKRVFVKRAHQELNPSRVEKAVGQFLSGFFPNGKYELKAFNVRGIDPYPQGDLSLVFDKRYTPSKNGRLCLHAEVWVDGIKVDRLPVNGRLSQFKSVVVALKRLERGEAVTPADVSVKEMDVFGLQLDALTSVNQVNGMVMTRTIDKGECITRDKFKQAPAIKRGAVVKLVAKKNRLSIVTLGECQEDGYPGRPVTVQNLTSGKLVRGIVTADGIVEVIF